jgi:hypothetical protein
MKIAFIDPYPYPYNAETPLKQPLGGTQSAVAYLSAELVRLGAHVTVVNGVEEPATSAGVSFVPKAMLSARFLNQFDAAVVVAGAQGRTLRDHGVTVPMVLWCHYAPDQPDVQRLTHADERAAWNGYAMLTPWQAERYVSAFNLPRAGLRVLGNAVSPAFRDLPDHEPWFQRGEAPILF